MKKLFLVVFIMFIATYTNAQFPISLGPKLGFNMSKIPTSKKGAQSLNESNFYGFQGGLFVRLKLKKILIQPEVYFSMKGGKVDYTLNGSYSREVKINTIDVPLMFGYKAVDLKVFNLRLMVGPVVSFAINKSIKFTDNGTANPTVSENNFKNTNWAIQAGVGVDIFMLTLDVRYEWGLNKMYNMDSETLKNNLLCVSLGWKIF